MIGRLYDEFGWREGGQNHFEAFPLPALNVIDPETLQLPAPTIVYDLPAGGRRLVQRARGYEVTMVSGAVTYRNGEATGALPGRLVRGAQPVPAESLGAAA